MFSSFGGEPGISNAEYDHIHTFKDGTAIAQQLCLVLASQAFGSD